MVDGFDKTDASYLKKIIQVLSAVGKFLYNAEYQTQVSLDHLFPCFPVTGAGSPYQGTLFRLAQNRQL